jgi:YaiO family outer membrane protein
LAAVEEEAQALVRARELVRERRLEESVIVYTRVLERNPWACEARLGRARVLGWLGRYDDALSDLDAALAQQPQNAEAQILRGRVLGWAGRYAEAEAELHEALRTHAHSSDARVALADLLVWEGREEEALEMYREAQRLAPADPEPLVGLARIRLRGGDLEGARAGYEEALRLAPDREVARRELERIDSIRRASAFRPLRLELGGRIDALDEGFDDWSFQRARLTARRADGMTVSAGVERYRRFGERDTHWTAGGSGLLPGGYAISGALTVGPGASVVARRIYEVGIERRVASGLAAELRYRRSEYPGGVDVDLVSPAVHLGGARFELVGTYHFAHSPRSGSDHAVSARWLLYPESRLSGYVGAAYGRETFAASTVEEIRERARVIAAFCGLRWKLDDRSGLQVDYEYESRDDSYDRHGIGGGIFVDF